MKDCTNEFEELLLPDAYQAAWRFACYLACSRMTAEDILQDALLKAYQQFDQLRDKAKFQSWLLKIVRNTYLTHQRRSNSGVKESYVPDWQNQSEMAAMSYSSVDLSDDLADQMACGLARLPAVLSEVLVLFYLEGNSLKETADILSSTPNAVTQRLHRARAAMRKQLEQDSPPQGVVCPTERAL